MHLCGGESGVNDEKTEKVDKAAPKFNWVTERSSCSLPKIFKDLRAQVEEDVKTPVTACVPIIPHTSFR